MLSDAQEWLDYRLDAFGGPLALWNGTPDFTPLRARYAADPVFVEGVLTEGLIARDPIAAEAVQHLPLSSDSRAGFIRLLTACLGTQSTGFHLKAVEVLHTLSGDEAWADEVVRVLLGAGYWRDRREAARVLGAFRPTAGLIQSLSRAIEDPDFLVRRQAADTLLVFGGHAPDVAANGGLLAKIRNGTTPVDWSHASSELSAEALANARVR